MERRALRWASAAFPAWPAACRSGTRRKPSIGKPKYVRTDKIPDAAITPQPPLDARIRIKAIVILWVEFLS